MPAGARRAGSRANANPRADRATRRRADGRRFTSCRRHPGGEQRIAKAGWRASDPPDERLRLDGPDLRKRPDRDGLVGGGLGIPLPYEFVPGAVGYDPSAPFYEFNLDKAKQLIQESGVTTPLDVRFTVHSREQDVQQAQLIQQMVDKIGVKLNLDVVERVAWGEKVRIQNDFQMASRQSDVLVDPTDDLLVTWAEGGNSAYHRAKVPGLIDTLHRADAEYDPQKRHDLFVQAQKLMYDSAWFGYIWFEMGNFLVHQRIQNFPGTWGSLRESEWWISEA